MPAGKFIPEIIQPRPKEKDDLVFYFQNRELLIRNGDGAPEFPTFAELYDSAEGTDGRFIGSIDGRSCYAAAFDGEPPEGYRFETLRNVFLQSSVPWRSVMSTAVLVVDWDANHRFCGRCGTKTEVESTEWCRKCPSCGQRAYPRISPAVIVAVIKDKKILLAHNKRFSSPIYSLIAGFVEPGEFLEDTVRREVLEETGLAVGDIRYYGSQAWPFPDSLMIGFIARYQSGEITLNEELEDAGWFTPDGMPEIPVHGSISRRIIDWYLASEGDGALPEDAGQ